MSGGYDDGYSRCPCFWGSTPGSLVQYLSDELGDLAGLMVLDLGCGEGKNAAYLTKLGCLVRAIDVSSLALKNARAAWAGVPRTAWELADVRGLSFPTEKYDIGLAYGLLHCLSSADEINTTVRRLQNATRPRGYNIIVALNNRFQDLGPHPNLDPCLQSHAYYLALYSSWEIIQASDSDLIESHPNNLIEHRHSLTRILARKP
jgi:SAM-dependent methyltransferase